jgi:hypothetical protein
VRGDTKCAHAQIEIARLIQNDQVARHRARSRRLMMAVVRDVLLLASVTNL